MEQRKARAVGVLSPGAVSWFVRVRIAPLHVRHARGLLRAELTSPSHTSESSNEREGNRLAAGARRPVTDSVPTRGDVPVTLTSGTVVSAR